MISKIEINYLSQLLDHIQHFYNDITEVNEVIERRLKKYFNYFEDGKDIENEEDDYIKSIHLVLEIGHGILLEQGLLTNIYEERHDGETPMISPLTLIAQQQEISTAIKDYNSPMTNIFLRRLSSVLPLPMDSSTIENKVEDKYDKLRIIMEENNKLKINKLMSIEKLNKISILNEIVENVYKMIFNEHDPVLKGPVLEDERLKEALRAVSEHLRTLNDTSTKLKVDFSNFNRFLLEHGEERELRNVMLNF